MATAILTAEQYEQHFAVPCLPPYFCDRCLAAPVSTMDAVCSDCTPLDDAIGALFEAAEDAAIAWDAFANEAALSTGLWRYESSRIPDVSAARARLLAAQKLALDLADRRGTVIQRLVVDPPDVVYVHVTSPAPRRPGWIASVCAVFLTLAGILMLAAAGLVWAAGWLMGRVWTEAGAATMAVAKAVFVGIMHAVDAVNGHERKQPEPAVVIHTIETTPVVAPSRLMSAAPATPPPPAPAEPSRAQLLADATQRYISADLIDRDDDPAMLERRISAILGNRE